MKPIQPMIVGIIVVVVVVVVAAFFGGMKYSQSQRLAGRGAFGSQGVVGNFQNGARGGSGARGRAGGGFGGAVVGEVLSQDEKSLTVKLQDGSSRIVILSDTTTFSKSDQAAKTDLKTGDRVAVFGAPNADGSVTAQSVQLNPMMRGPMPTKGSPR